jgi:hypothetical protein
MADGPAPQASRLSYLSPAAREALRIVLSFVLIGPPVGGLIVGAFMLLGKWLGAHDPLDLAGLGDLLATPLFTMVAAYPVGFVPALLSGAAYAFFDVKLKRSTRLAACVAALLGNFCAWLLLFAASHAFWPQFWSVVAFTSALSIPAGLLSRRVVQWRRKAPL